MCVECQFANMSTVESLRKNLAAYKQEHLLQFWDSLTESERNDLTADIDEINLEAVLRDFQKVTSDMKTEEKINDHIKPVPKSLFGDVSETPENILASYRDEGLRLISENKIAVLVLAGGQGTRLGVSYPKGEKPVDYSLFVVKSIGVALKWFPRIRKLDAGRLKKN